MNNDGKPDECFATDTDGDGVKDCISNPTVKTNTISCLSYGSLTGEVEAAEAQFCLPSPPQKKAICFTAQASITEPGSYLQLTDYEKCCPPLLTTNQDLGTLVYSWSISGPEPKEGSGPQACVEASKPGEYTVTFTISVTNCHCPPPSLVLSTSAVLTSIDLDVDANLDGNVNADDEDAETSPGGLVAVTNACFAQREKIVLQFYGDDGAKPTERPLALRWPAKFVDIFRTPSGGAPLALNGRDNRFSANQLPLTFWVQAKRPSASVGDITVSLTHENLGCSDEIKLTAAQLTLYADTQNRQGNSTPSKDRAVAKLKAPGKIVPVNRLDWDDDGIPDYADPKINDAQTLMPMLLELLPAGLSHDKLNFKLFYSGKRSAPDLASFKPQAILHKGAPSGYQDYRGARTGVMRVWNLDQPDLERRIQDYVVPEKAYALQELRRDAAGERVLWLEGINPEAVRVRAEVTVGESRRFTCDEVLCTVAEAKLGLNMSNDHEDDRMRPGVPDVEFVINEDDEVIKDQKDGFTWWWATDQFRPISRAGITDLFPLHIEYAPVMKEAGLISCLSVGNFVGAFVYPAVSPIEDARAFLKTEADAVKQVNVEAQGMDLWRDPTEIKLPGAGPRHALMMKVAGKDTGRDRLVLWSKDAGGNIFPVDTWRMTLKNAEHFWVFISTRGTPNRKISYPTEGTGTCNLIAYPTASTVAGHPVGLDLVKTKQFVWIHGFNVRLDEARAAYNEIFKRLYWLGYRGNFIGLTWDGDVPRGVITDLPLGFDSAVGRAFQTAPSVQLLLQTLSEKVGANNVNIAAHSLGNLVMFDALRLQARMAGTPICRNAISVQGAVWREAFDPKRAISYETPSDPIHYTEDQLQRNSWAFWFNQQGGDSRDALAGRVYHGYSETDTALVEAMRFNDYIFRGTFDYPGWIIPVPLPGVYGWHYNRNAVESLGEYRAPVGKTRLWDRVPALMQPEMRSPTYKSGALTVPIGAATENPLASATETRNAIALGWREDAHSDHLSVDFHKDHGWGWFPRAWPWYDKFLGVVDPDLPPTIPLGEE